MKRDTLPASVSEQCEWMDWLGSGLLKAPMAVRPMPDAAATARDDASPAPQMPVLIAAHIPQLLLPTAGHGGDTSRSALARAAIAHATGHLRYSAAAQPTLGLTPLAIVVASALEDARVDLLTVRDYPGIHAWFMRCWQAVTPSEGLDLAALLQRLGRALLDCAYEDRNPWVQQARTRFGALADLSDAAACRRLASVLANELGQMRVPFDASQPYQVPVAYRDDNSWLWAFEQTAADATASIADGLQPHTAPAAPGRTTQAMQPAQASNALAEPAAVYPEWDYRLKRLRPAWCTVHDRPATAGSSAGPWPARSARMRPPRNRSSAAPRLSRDGDTLQLDAAVAALLDLRLQATPPDAVFMRDAARRRRPLHASLLVLLDLSESTNDAFGGGVGLPASDAHAMPDPARTILAIEKDAARHLASHYSARGARVAVHGFHSHTRADVGYYRLLDFGQPLDAAALQRIASVRASLSTRTGAALRHATARLAQERSRHRCIVLISDGAPSDVDVFTSGQLAQDAARAMQEARRRGIAVRCLAIGLKAGRELKGIAGSGSAVATIASVTGGQRLTSLIARQLVRW